MIPSDPTRFLGYRSPESRRAVHRAAWVGAILIGLLQLVIPVGVIGWAIVHAFVGALTTPSPEVTAPAAVGDHVVYTVPIREEGDSLFAQEARRRLVRVRLGDDAAPEPIAELEGEADPMLLAVGEVVWAIDADAVAIVEGSTVRKIELAEPLPSTFAPVLFEGAPAVVTIDRDFEGDGHELVLRVWDDDRFVARGTATATLGFDARQVRVVAVGAALHVFADGYDAPVHATVWAGDRVDPWTRTPIEGGEWTAVAHDGVPVVFALDEAKDPTELVGWRQSSGWRKFISGPAPSAFHIGAVALDDGRVAITTDTTLDGLAVTTIDANAAVDRHEHSTSTLMEETVGIIVLGQLAPVLLTGLLTLVLASRMRVHRTGEYVHGHRMARYASLTRRMLARAIDGAIAIVVPLVVLLPTALDDPSAIDQNTLIGVCLLWGLPVGIGLTLLEGKFGQTPGKRLLGIRVVGLDLRAPGIGAAFLRGLAGIADGFFDGLVGIVAVATTEHWQRVGDLVAHTVVIDDAIVERD